MKNWLTFVIHPRHNPCYPSTMQHCLYWRFAIWFTFLHFQASKLACFANLSEVTLLVYAGLFSRTRWLSLLIFVHFPVSFFPRTSNVCLSIVDYCFHLHCLDSEDDPISSDTPNLSKQRCTCALAVALLRHLCCRTYVAAHTSHFEPLWAFLVAIKTIIWRYVSRLWYVHLSDNKGLTGLWHVAIVL